MSESAKRPRRTQGERTAETRGRLLEAAVAVLAERGYGRLTTAEVADRAGVSRGALTHHFGAKDDLVVEGVALLLTRSTDEIRRLAGEVAAGRLALDAFLDRLWEMFEGPLFWVTLEHVTEARHNPALRERLVPVVREFHRALDEIWRGFFRASGLDAGEIETRLNATLCLLRGMGVQSVLRDDPAYFAGLLAWWKGELRRLVEPAASDPSRARPVTGSGPERAPLDPIRPHHAPVRPPPPRSP